ncbi:MAG: PTS sugar transporter subunit IIA [Treponema sp.]|nr:PTS sugar transporter subunit IIA [Treponema sp.]
MFLQDVFLPECIKVDLEAEDKDEAFEELVDYICQSGKMNLRKDFLKALWEREAEMSTGIQKGIAIPHGKTAAINSVYGVVGISRKGIDYDALDGEPVYLLFMIMAPKNDSEQYLRILKNLAELLENPRFYIDLQSQKNAQDAYKIITKYENELITLE